MFRYSGCKERFRADEINDETIRKLRDRYLRKETIIANVQDCTGEKDK